jgi:hypothetical protein
MTMFYKKAAAAASLAVVTMLGGVALPSRVLAADNVWVGTWKLDPAKSNFAGDTMTYSKSSNGAYRYSDGGTVSYDFGIDGKGYPTPYGRTITWSAVNDHAWDSVLTAQDGTVLAKIHRELSSGDKTLTVTATGTKPDGSTFNETSVYARTGGAEGLAGKWRSTKSNAGSPEKFVISSPAPGVLRWDIPDYKQTGEGKLDGTDFPITGPTAPPGMTVGIKAETATKLSYVMKFNGKPDNYGVDTMAADGRSYTDVNWSAGKESEKTTAVYVRQ